MDDSATDKTKCVNMPGEEQPSTSSGPVEINHDTQQNKEEMDRLLQATNEMLENKAKSMNLSSLNVRSILHHLIKYPSTIDVLLGIRDTDDLPTVRNTRSRKRPGDSAPTSATQTPKKFALRIEDKGPKNFLDLEYQEDDEFDDDYVEENETSPREDAETGDSEDDEENDDEEIGDEDDEEEIEQELQEINEHSEKTREDERETAASSSSANNSFQPLVIGEHTEEQQEEKSSHLSMTLNETMPRSESAAPVYTLDNVLDDVDYRDFVNSINGPNAVLEQTPYDTDDDEDYNVIADNMIAEDWDETRQDKTTMIPRHEVKALMMDTLLAEKEIPIHVFPEEAIVLENEEFMRLQRRRDEEAFHRQNVSGADSVSCSLLQDDPVTFRDQELLQLEVQLEQHVQLLTQFVVTCHHDVYLAHIRNDAQVMLNELDDVHRSKPLGSVFHVKNLDAAIDTCHDICGFEEVDDEDIRWDKPGDRLQGTIIRPEAAAVLSRSYAIRFPDLLIPFQPSFITSKIPFLQSEDLLLALGLLQFGHLPRRPEKGLTDRYTAIHQYCLPARDPYTIRSHLKTMRRPNSNPSPIHQIIQAAERGICNIFLPEKNRATFDMPVSMWPPSSQPAWYNLFVSRFNVTENREIHRKNEGKLLLTPVKRLQIKEGPVGDDGEENAGEQGEESDLVEVGEGPGGQLVVMGRNDLHELVIRMLKEEVSPSRRRKNSTPMKLSTIPVLAEVSHIVEEQEALEAAEKAKITPSLVNAPSTSSSCSLRSPTLTPLPESYVAPRDSRMTNSSANVDTNTQNVTVDARVSSAASEFSEDNLNMPFASSAAESDSDECSLQNPPTPGRRPPDEHDFMDLESNSLTWCRTSHSVTTGNPRTPRGFIMSSEITGPIDFSAMVTASDPANTSSDTEDYFIACQAPMGMPGRSEIVSDYVYSPYHSSESASSLSAAPPIGTPSEVMEEDSMTGLDLVPIEEEYDPLYCEDVALEDQQDEDEQSVARKRRHSSGSGEMNVRSSRKRTRAQREQMGAVGLADENLHEQQKAAIVKRVIDDVRKRLFMHAETWERLTKTLSNEELSEDVKINETVLLLSGHPRLLSLVLLYAPPELIPAEFQANPFFQSHKIAVEMILDVERYVAGAKIKEPSIRNIFRYIRSFVEAEPDLNSEQAARKFFQLLGQDRPLWSKLEPHFHCLPHRSRPQSVEKFEFVDLSLPEPVFSKREKREKIIIPPQFEIVDDIDQVCSAPYRYSRYEEKSNLVVKFGEFCVRDPHNDTYTQLVVRERQWARKDDITLLTRYNEAVRANPQFDDEDTPSLVPELNFGAKSVVARLKYLLAELKTT